MVQIIVDSTCDLTRERMDELGIICVPLTVTFGEQVFIDGVDLTSEEFYNNLRANEDIPTTAQPTPHAFEEAIQGSLARGNEVVCVLLGDKLSGTVQSATIAKDTLESDKVWVVDTDTVCSALGVLVEIAAQRAKDGASGEAIYNEIKELAPRAKIYAAVETLKYLRKGGRLSGTAAVIGTMLNLHPIITVKDGMVANIGKAKGKKKLYALMKEFVLADGVDTAYPIFFSQGDALENLESLKTVLGEDLDLSKAVYGGVGPVLGTHVGPGMVTVGFIAKK